MPIGALPSGPIRSSLSPLSPSLDSPARSSPSPRHDRRRAFLRRFFLSASLFPPHRDFLSLLCYLSLSLFESPFLSLGKLTAKARTEQRAADRQAQAKEGGSNSTE